MEICFHLTFLWSVEYRTKTNKKLITIKLNSQTQNNELFNGEYCTSTLRFPFTYDNVALNRAYGSLSFKAWFTAVGRKEAIENRKYYNLAILMRFYV